MQKENQITERDLEKKPREKTVKFLSENESISANSTEQQNNLRTDILNHNNPEGMEIGRGFTVVNQLLE